MTRAVRLEPASEPAHVVAARRRVFAAALFGAMVVGALAGVFGPRGGL